MSAGVSGATLWVPVYLLWLKLDAPLAFWLGLLTMLFGFGSGVIRNLPDSTFDGVLVRRYLLIAVPAALVGGWLSGSVNQAFIVALFGAFLIVYAILIAGRTLRMRPSLISVLRRNSSQMFTIAMWAVPGVVIGGQIGPRLAQMLPSERQARLYFSAVLLIVGVLTLARAAAVR